jgi:Tfp pilus assembly protein PilV
MRNAMDGAPQKTPRQSRGFSLVEVLTAGFILTLAVLGLSASLANGSRLADGSRQELIARDAMRDCLARLQETPFDQVAMLYHTRGFRADAIDVVDGDLDGLPGEIIFSQGPGDAIDVYRVTLRVRWRGVGGERVIESSHYIANSRGDPGAVPTVEEVEAALAAS